MSSRNRLIALLAFAAIPLWAQVDSSGAAPAGEEPAFWSRVDSSEAEPAAEEAPMIPPAPLNDEGYSLAFASETPRTNYLRGGVSLGAAYDDNVLPSSGQAVSDVRYSIWPSLSLQQSRSRLGWSLSYSPGYTFHQHLGSINGVDQNVALGFEYRLSPHVTLSVENSFQKTSDLLNLPNQSVPPSESGGVHGPGDVIVPPATARISNFSDAAITYQFGQNAMIGAKSTLSGLWYPDRANLSGLFDSTATAALGFYAHRLSGRHYIGATYGFQRLSTHPGQGETQTQSTLLFYTLYLPPSLAVSLFAGPEHSDTRAGASLTSVLNWSPAAGGSLAWRKEHSSFVARYARRIGDGGGLSGAVLSNQADVYVRWQFARTMTTGLGASYSTNSVLLQPMLGVGGHSWSGTASLQRPLGNNLGLQMGYTHLHQNYSSVSAISKAPDRNTAWISISYQFERPLGR